MNVAGRNLTWPTDFYTPNQRAFSNRELKAATGYYWASKPTITLRFDHIAALESTPIYDALAIEHRLVNNERIIAELRASYSA